MVLRRLLPVVPNTMSHARSRGLATEQHGFLRYRVVVLQMKYGSLPKRLA
jgi:hypothetical protein